MPDFFRSAPHAGPRSHGCAAGLRGVECKVEKLANGRGSNVQARITGGIINIHLTVIIRNSTIGKYHVGNIADALPATRRDQKSGRFGNHFPGLFQIGHKQVDHIAQALRSVAHAMGNVQPATGRLDVGRALAVLAFGDGVAAAA